MNSLEGRLFPGHKSSYYKTKYNQRVKKNFPTFEKFQFNNCLVLFYSATNIC